jgi:YD repeat-containing protein
VGYPDGSFVSMNYDELNRLDEIEDYTDFDYTILSQIGSITYSNDVTTDYIYDSMNRPINILTQKSANTLLNLTYIYDKSGSVTGINNGSYTETYGYGLLDRLNSTVGPWGSITYSYDPVGNRLSKSVEGGSTTTYSYDNMDRLTSAIGMTMGICYT